MRRMVLDAARATGSLLVEGSKARALAFDEDATTLAIDAARALPDAPLAFVGPGIDAVAIRAALRLPAEPAVVDDPLHAALAASGRVLAVARTPGAPAVVAALVGDGDADEPAEPRDVSGAPRIVDAERARREAGQVQLDERIPDSPMGAYVPWGTWLEDLEARLGLVAQRCAACDRVQYPPRGVCVACGGEAFAPHVLASTPRVYVATRISRGGAPSEFALEQALLGDFWVAVVEWPEEGVRVTARLSGYESREPRIGDALRPVVRLLFTQEGRARYGTKFAPR